MSLQMIKRWQWLATGVAVGLLIGGVRRWNVADLVGYGQTLVSTDSFARALTTTINGTPMFTDVRVHRQVFHINGADVTMDVVRGSYCDGRPDATDGRLRWRPAVYFAPVPLRLQPGDRAAAEFAPELARLPAPSVLDFLNQLHDRHGVNYVHAWWDTWPLASALFASTVMIGVIWPTLIDLLIYHRLVRPIDKGISLRNVRSARKPAEPEGMSAEELARIAAFEAQLERSAQSVPPPELAPSQAAAHGPRAPMSAPVDAAPPVPPAEDPKSFGAGDEDYYPTEVHISRQSADQTPTNHDAG